MRVNSVVCGLLRTKVILFALFLGIALVIPAFTHIQWLTGPLVNTVLILTVVLVGPMEAVIVGLAPSPMALSTGLLPLPLAPMVPFIMVGNAVLVAVFYYFYKKSFLAALTMAAVAKFVFLYGSVILIMNGLLEKNFVEKLSIMMSWPQLMTALVGGLIAYGLLNGFKRI